MATWICGRGCETNVTQKTGRPAPCEPHGAAFYYPKALGANGRKPMRAVSEKRQREEDEGKRPARLPGSTFTSSGSGFAAAPAQREKVKGLVCVGCGREAGGEWTIDPMHLWPRSLGGCDHPLCVLPGCRHVVTQQGCHTEFDAGRLDLLARLLDGHYFAELAHATEAHELSPLTLVNHTTGLDYVPAAPLRRELEAERARIFELEASIPSSGQLS
jgi:hypothetical protein